MYQANTRQFSQKTYSLFPLLLMTLVSLGLWSQEEDPELVLPEMILEVTTAGVEDVQALLPEEEDLPLPELALPLPEVEALDVRSIEMEGFTLEYRPGQEEFGAAVQSDLFLNARLGLGSPNALEAFFQVRKLGNHPVSAWSLSIVVRTAIGCKGPTALPAATKIRALTASLES
jgi:hypothetical protein